MASGEATSASSRVSRHSAGWECATPGRHGDLAPGRLPFSWISPWPLWISRNDKLSRWFGDPTNDRRRAWMKGRAEGNPDLLIDRAGDAISFLAMGDTGEGDASQWAVVLPAIARAEGTAFTFISSDVIYPAGGVNAYDDCFFRPYAELPGPIYAVPGNHDWYDDLTGFMYWFCKGRERPKWGAQGLSPRVILRRLLWHRPPRVRKKKAAEAAARRSAPGQQGVQPAPYFAIDAGPLRLVGIDTGISGELDRDQGEWLRRVSSDSPKPKILLTGKPIYVDGDHREGAIEGGGTVDEIVTAPGHNYIAAIGGDIHNYQRYPVELADGRTLMYLVNGGGGAFMHETHTIPSMDTLEVPVSEADFRCYPLRGDSLSRFSQLWARKLFGRLKGARFIPPDEAAAIVGKRLGGLTPTRPSARAVEPTPESERAAKALFDLPARKPGALHLPFSEYLDWNEPPLFKSFLRVDADHGGVTIRCFAATGCGEHEQDPPLEDELTATKDASGRWNWAYA
jgi:hypothetical protein